MLETFSWNGVVESEWEIADDIGRHDAEEANYWRALRMLPSGDLTKAVVAFLQRDHSGDCKNEENYEREEEEDRRRDHPHVCWLLWVVIRQAAGRPRRCAEFVDFENLRDKVGRDEVGKGNRPDQGDLCQVINSLYVTYSMWHTICGQNSVRNVLNIDRIQMRLGSGQLLMGTQYGVWGKKPPC